MYTTPQLVTLALSLMNISPSLTKSQHFLNPAILLFVHFVVSVLTSITKKKQLVPSPHPLSILNLTTATLFIIIFLTLNYTDSSRFSTLLPALFQYSKNLSHHSSPIASLHWLKIKERIEYKLLSLTYKILTTTPVPSRHPFVIYRHILPTRITICTKLSQLILRKIIKIVATRCQILRNLHQIRFRLGLCPRPRWGSLQRSPLPSWI